MTPKDITALSNAYHRATYESAYGHGVLDEIHKLIKHDYHMLRQRGYTNGNLYNKNITSCNSLLPTELFDIIQRVVSNPKILARLLTTDENIHYMIDIVEKEERKLNDQQHVFNERQSEEEAKKQYEEAIAVVDELGELGSENLDEEQCEEYDEMIDIIRKYEK